MPAATLENQDSPHFLLTHSGNYDVAAAFSDRKQNMKGYS